MTTPPRQAIQLHVRGVVQGVGFRPFIHRLAMRHGLGGWVRNEAGGVRIEIEGDPTSIQRFREALMSEAPPLAQIQTITAEPVDPKGAADFRVLPSRIDTEGRLPVSPDLAMCDACSAELRDPGNRRYRFPFITCTDCGPRFTVIESMPYDRERTSMRAFPQCQECRREYSDPNNRRYHCETNSCAACGPRLWLESAAEKGERTTAERRGIDDVIREAADLLRTGEILAIRGLGGFHLAVDATNESAVRRLRERKNREAKPLAVMVGSIDDAHRLAVISDVEAEWLASPERPIVVLEAKSEAGIAPAVSPGLSTIGLFLTYTPLHALLLESARIPLVMTSGNRTEEPIVTSNEDARRNLALIADALVLHDREIVARYDDSVVRVAGHGGVMLRRARGYAPLPLKLPVPACAAILAAGPHLKNTFTLALGEDAWVSQHIGDLENLETLIHFKDAFDRFRHLFGITPGIAARDMHPEYLSSRLADEMGFDHVIPVQHHHAHIAAVAAEHGITDRVVGLAFDGTGYGEDGKVWGAEVLVADLSGYQRAGQLRYAPLPGGDLASRRPWRAALGYLSLEPALAPAFDLAFGNVPPAERAIANAQIARDINSPLASSMGRLFDAAAAVLGIRHENRYEAQAAMELESLAGRRAGRVLPFPIGRLESRWVMDPLPLLAALGERALSGYKVAELAASFHESVAETAAQLAQRVCAENDVSVVALGGGVFQNSRLLDGVRTRLSDHRIRVLMPLKLGPNDGGVSYGQAAVAAWKTLM